ncbi:vasculin-like [Ptychodera flava]|uniref:vasculin-like n=1 Tax=Ptychodera flava TaxID=63121 RepID=UPI00396A6A5B
MKKEWYAMPIDVMANPPQHDFAPAWLNFPSEQKPFKAHQYEHHQRHERGSRSYDRDESGYLSNQERLYSSESHLAHAGHPPLQTLPHAGYGYRGRDDKRHQPHPGYTRHHSLDDDRYYHNVYQSGDSIYHQGTSPWRSPRDGIYQHPNARFGNGTYHGGGNNYHGNRSTGRQRYNSGSRNEYHDRGRQDSKEENRDCDVANDAEDDINESSNNNNSVDTGEKFEQEFPSLRGDVGSGNKETQSNKPAGVWDKPPNSKVHNMGGRRMQLIQKPLRNESTDSSSNGGTGDTGQKLNPHAGIVNQANKTATSNTASNSIYKSLVPSKGHTKSASRKPPPVKELSSKQSVPPVAQTKPTTPTPVPTTSQSITKEVPQRPASTPPIEILNPRLVTAQTKKLDKKSDFLKELRKGSSNYKDENHKDDENGDECSSDEEENHEQNGNRNNEFGRDMKMTNEVDMYSKGMCHRETETRTRHTLETNHLDNLTITSSPGSSPMKTELSSSLEAERRLLREMGWEEDIDEKPLTEDELREFQAITAKLDNKPSKLRNGFNHNLIPKWSPVHNINKIDLNESESDCTSDSSDDEDGP